MAAQRCWRCGEETPNDPRTCDRCREILEAEQAALGLPDPLTVIVGIAMELVERQGKAA